MPSRVWAGAAVLSVAECGLWKDEGIRILGMGVMFRVQRRLEARVGGQGLGLGHLSFPRSGTVGLLVATATDGSLPTSKL